MEKSRRVATVSAKRRKAADKSGALRAAVPSTADRSFAEAPLEELEVEVAARRREKERREAEAQTPEGSEAGTGGFGIEGKLEL
jgi:hypothetical protein